MRSVGPARPSRWLRRTVGVLAGTCVLLIGAPACGGGDTTETGDGAKKTATSIDAKNAPTIPDLGLGKPGDCLKMAGTYAALALLVVRGGDQAAAAEAQVRSLKDQLPAELHDDIDTIADTFAAIAKTGVAKGAAELQKPAYTKANEAVLSYLTTTCGGR